MWGRCFIFFVSLLEGVKGKIKGYCVVVSKNINEVKVIFEGDVVGLNVLIWNCLEIIDCVFN